MRAPILALALTVMVAPASAAPSKKTTSKSSKSTKSKSKSKKKAPTPPKRPPFPCSAMPWSPILLSTHVTRDGETAHVTHDLMVTLQTPSSEPNKDARFFLAFGGPGLPRSLRVEFAPVHDGELSFPAGDLARVRALPFVQSPDSEGACTLLGRGNEAGVLVPLPPEARVDVGAKLGILRIEQHVQLGQGEGGRDLVLRLSNWNDTPVRTGPIASKEPLVREYCAHGRPPILLQGSLLGQSREVAHDLCVTFPAGKR